MKATELGRLEMTTRMRSVVRFACGRKRITQKFSFHKDSLPITTKK